MLENAWNEYRGWAKRARELQQASQLWSRAAMFFAVLAAILGAASGQVGTEGAGRILAFLAAVCAAITPVLGQDLLSVGREVGWIRARATAETLKSECFRYAARAGDYAEADAAAKFRVNRDQAIEAATKAGLISLEDPLAADPRRPGEPLDLDWYLKERLQGQRKYFADRQVKNEKEASRLRTGVLVTSVFAAVLGAASSTLGWTSLAPWIGVLGTLGAMILAYGLMERKQYLAVSYGAMTGALGRIAEVVVPGGPTLRAIVAATEDLLASEHAAWSDRMLKTITKPPAAKLDTPETKVT